MTTEVTVHAPISFFISLCAATETRIIQWKLLHRKDKHMRDDEVILLITHRRIVIVNIHKRVQYR